MQPAADLPYRGAWSYYATAGWSCQPMHFLVLLSGPRLHPHPHCSAAKNSTPVHLCFISLLGLVFFNVLWLLLMFPSSISWFFQPIGFLNFLWFWWIKFSFFMFFMLLSIFCNWERWIIAANWIIQIPFSTQNSWVLEPFFNNGWPVLISLLTNRASFY